MRVELAEIAITKLRLRTFTGFNPDERFNRQDVAINLRIKFWTQRGIFQDYVADAPNYKNIPRKLLQPSKAVVSYPGELVSDVIDIFAELEDVTFAKVKVDKPHALQIADSVSLTMEYCCE